MSSSAKPWPTPLPLPLAVLLSLWQQSPALPLRSPHPHPLGLFRSPLNPLVRRRAERHSFTPLHEAVRQLASGGHRALSGGRQGRAALRGYVEVRIRRVSPDGERAHFDIEPMHRTALLEGLDEIGLTLKLARNLSLAGKP